MEAPTPGQLLREARRRHRVTQAQLAIRASTTQSAISRIERDRVSPSVETLRELLHLLGEDLVLVSESRDTGVDLAMTRGNLDLGQSDRVRRGIALADLVRRNRGAARRAA